MLIGVLRRTVYRLHFVLACLVGGPLFLAFSALGVLFVFLRPSQARKAPVFFANNYGRMMTGVLGWKVDADHLEEIEAAAPALLVVNHQSNLDVVTCGRIFPPRTVVIGKKELARIPAFGWFFRSTGNILIDRKSHHDARRAIQAAASRVREDRVSVWMFPEGHRNQKPELLPFKKGAFHLAIAAQVPVVALVVEPIASVLDARRALVRPGRIRIRVLPPFPTAGLQIDDVDGLVERVHAAMQSARDDLAATARERIG